jgi:hypothetical protein
VIESVFEQLVDWAASALEKSSNQPVLPHAVIVLNASEHEIDTELWDVEVTTRKIFNSVSSPHTIYQNTKFQKYAQFWRERSREIETLEQLMLSYYGSVQVCWTILSRYYIIRCAPIH